MKNSKTEKLQENPIHISLKINTAKTKVLKRNTRNWKHVKIKDEQAQVVDTFTYLEVVTSVGGYDVDIKNTLRKTNSNFCRRLWRRHQKQTKKNKQ